MSGVIGELPQIEGRKDHSPKKGLKQKIIGKKIRP